MAEQSALNSTIAAARDRLPANFARLRAIHTHVEDVAVTHELACQCGAENGVIRATPAGEDFPYLDPVAFECPKCRVSVTFFDSKRDGYDGRLNDGACYQQGDQPETVACPQCGQAHGKLICTLLYSVDFEAEGELELLADAQDYFDFIEISVRCPNCGVTHFVNGWELA